MGVPIWDLCTTRLHPFPAHSPLGQWAEDSFAPRPWSLQHKQRKEEASSELSDARSGMSRGGTGGEEGW